MDNWKKVGTLNEFNVNNQWLIEIENRPIALFKYDNNFYALKNSCLHQGFSLAEGHLKSYMVECPLHGWYMISVMGNVSPLWTGILFPMNCGLRTII